MFINMGIGIKEIADRLGYESPQTTWGVYAHLYPGKDRELDKIRVPKKQLKIQISVLNIILTSRSKSKVRLSFILRENRTFALYSISIVAGGFPVQS